MLVFADFYYERSEWRNLSYKRKLICEFDFIFSEQINAHINE